MFWSNLKDQSLTRVAVIYASVISSVFTMLFIAGDILGLLNKLEALNDPFFIIIFIIFPVSWFFIFILFFTFFWSLTILLGKLFFKSQDNTRVKHLALAIVGLIVSFFVAYIYLGTKVLLYAIKRVDSSSQLERMVKNPIVYVNSRINIFDNNFLAKKIALHPQASPAVLETLFSFHSDYINILIAKNTNTPYSILENLASTSGLDIKSQLAKNPNTPPAILEKLYNFADTTLIGRDKSKEDNFDYSVIGAREIITNLLKNPSTPKNVLSKITKSYDLYFKVTHY